MDQSSGWWALALGVAGVVLAPALAFWTARRTSSGRIATSDAADLWNEGQKIRDFLNQQVSDLRSELTKAKEDSRSEILRLENLLTEKELEIMRLTTMVHERDERIERLERLAAGLGPGGIIG